MNSSALTFFICQSCALGVQSPEGAVHNGFFLNGKRKKQKQKQNKQKLEIEENGKNKHLFTNI